MVNSVFLIYCHAINLILNYAWMIVNLPFRISIHYVGIMISPLLESIFIYSI